MPAVSERQRRAMWAAAEGHSTLGIPEKVGKEFVKSDADDEGMLTELDIAKKIRDGVLKSPQKVGGMWLFDLRVTGTGTSYRAGLGEYVYRPTEHYLSDEFLERCQGLPVIFEHPDESLLNTEEWRSRGIGTSVLPYIPTQNDETHDTSEVWTIARIYDEDAAELMQTTHISTSPAIRLSPESGSRNVALEGGEKLLIEGKPDLLDHLAIAELGVWDKGGKPRGIANDQTLEK